MLAILSVGTLTACSSKPVRIPPGALGAGDTKPQEAPTWFAADGSKVTRTEVDLRPPRVVPRPDPDRPRFNARSPVGTNLERVTPVSRDRIFVDLFKLATPWVSISENRWDDGQPINLDAKGWVKSLGPRQFVGTQMASFEGGRFVVLYEGRGVLKLEGDLRVTSDNPGRLEFTAEPDTTITLTLQATNPSSPIRNIRVLPERLGDLGPEQPFHPQFLRAARVFSTLRFDGWTRATTSRLVRWSDRPLTDSASQASAYGVAYEYMIQLANELWADLWIPIPIRADNQHITKLAELIAVNLEPQLRVYVEFGDRMLVPGSAGYRFAVERGRALTASADADDAALSFYTERSTEAFKRFAKEFRRRTPPIRVLAGSARDLDRIDRMLKSVDGARGVDMLALDVMLGEEIRGGPWSAQVRRNDVQWLLDQIEQQSLPAALERVRLARQIADKHGVALTGYDAGLGLRTAPDEKDEAVEARFDRANRHPRLESIYASLLDGWSTNGGQLVNHAALASRYGRSGRAGAIESVGSLDTPKYRAILSFIRRSPRWWRSPTPKASPGESPVERSATPE